MIGNWPCTLPDGTVSEELVVRHGAGQGPRILIIPPLFSEHNLMRRQLVEMMRRLAEARIDSVLPDLPGWNESLVHLGSQTLAYWRDAMAEAAQFHGATDVLAVRSGALLLPVSLNGWSYAPHSGAKLLRAMIRARTIASRETGKAETSEELIEVGRRSGITLAGWTIGATMFAELEQAVPIAGERIVEISQSEVGGPALWLRAESGEDSDQAARLAAILSAGIAGSGSPVE